MRISAWSTGPRMEMITGGENFFLGMQDTPRYTRDISNMRLAMRRERRADDRHAVRRRAPPPSWSPPRRATIDVPQHLSLPVAARLLDHYFGTPGPSRGGRSPTGRARSSGTCSSTSRPTRRSMSRPKLKATAFRALARRPYRRAQGERRAARRRARPLPRHAGAAALPGMTDLDIRNNLIGLADRRAADDSRRPRTWRSTNCSTGRTRWPARRPRRARATMPCSPLTSSRRCASDPLNPVIYRRAMRDATMAGGTLARPPDPARAGW